MLRGIQRQAVQAIDRRILQRETRRPSQAVVQRLHSRSVDIRIKGSPCLWRNIPVRGAIGDISVGDTVAVHWLGRRPEVVSPGASSLQPS